MPSINRHPPSVEDIPANVRTHPGPASPLDAALWALEEGLWPVCITPWDDRRSKSPGKAPIGKGWGVERPDRATLEATYRRHPKAGVGLKLGAEGRVVDIDVDDPDQAGPVLARLFPDGPPRTLRWENAAGRFHLLFRYDDRLAKLGKSIIKGGEHYPGLEIRIGAPPGDARQLQSVIPPSLMTNGAARRWTHFGPILALPESVILDIESHAVPRPGPAKSPAASPQVRDTGGRSTPDRTTIPPTDVPLPVRLSRARKYAEDCDPAIELEGGSGQTLKVAALIGIGFDLAPDDAFAIMREVYNPTCKPPWPEDKLRRKVDEAYRLETRPPGFKLHELRSRVNGRAHTGPDLGRDGGDGTPPADGPGGNGPGDGPRVITITTAEYQVIDQAVDALADDPNVYQRSNILTTIIRDAEPRNRIILRPPGSPRIAPLPLPRLRELLTVRARWEKVRQTKDGGEASVPAHPPDWAVAGVAARGSWPEIRPVEAVTEAPVLRLDGTILDRPGYDERTALLFEPNAPFPPIPRAPTRDDAGRASDVLMGLVGDFPFAGENHRAAWLAALLTPLARFAIPGPCPLFLIDANTPGTGKSKLTDVIAVIASGRPMPRTTYPDSDDEMRKRISSIALAGDRLMLLDNIATTFGGSSLDSALTAMTWRDRILGRSEMTAELPLFTVWYATGNNVALRGDVLRRIVPCRLETHEERPEERREFSIQGDLLEHVQHERPRLVSAALTILRAHAVAGWPDGGLNPLGSFEAWSRVVRSAVHWACGLDPCRTREELRATDPEALARTALVEGWLDLPDGRTGLTAAAALKLVKESPAFYETVRDVFMEWSKSDDLPSARTVGRKLKALKGRVINGKRLLSSEERGILIWRVECDQPAD